MPHYDELTTTAFHLQPDGLRSLEGQQWVLNFPRNWIAPIVDLQQAADPRRRSLPIAALNRALRSLVPDIAAVNRGVGNTGHPGDWLYSAAPVPIDGLEPVIHGWLRATAEGEPGSELWRRLPKGEFAWRQLTPDELGWPTAAPGVPPESHASTESLAGMPRALFYLVPETLTAELLRRSDRPDGFPRGFRRCPTTDGSSVELMTWPPLESTDRRSNSWPFSYRVRLSLQTNPFQLYPVLHVTVGIRRWCHRAPSTGRGRGVNAYLLCSVPWITGLPASRSFRMAPMRWRMINSAWALQWRSELAYLFDQISFDQPLPDPAVLGHDPLPFLNAQGSAGSAAAIVYTTSAGYSHRVGAGVSARDRDRIVNWIGTTLSDIITPAPTLPRVPITLARTMKPTSTAVRERLRDALDKASLTVELYWDTETVRDALRRAVTEDLGLDPADGIAEASSTRWITPELDVIIRARSVGALGAPLRPDPSINDFQIRARRAAQPRAQEVQNAVAVADGSVVSLIELRNRAAFPQPGSDPKAALRIGFAATGRLTQFITPDRSYDSNPDERLNGKPEKEAELQHRAAAAWLDLRRQLAGVVQPLRPTIKGMTVPDPVDTVAVFMIRRNATERQWAGRHQLPIAIWTSSDDPAVRARTLGMGEWRPYREVLLELAAGRAFKLPDCSERQTMAFIRSVITSVQADRPVLLLTWAQNLRSDWPAIKNSELAVNQTVLDGVPIGNSAPHLRHVRIRTSDSDETPQCYGLHSQGVGLPSGLWRLPGSDRIFASTAGKPSSAKTHGSPMGSRIEIRLDRLGRAILEDRKAVWNPQLVELTVAAIRPGDDPATWAALAHAQRRVSETYADWLTFPLPLQLARKAAEYAIPSPEEEIVTDSGAGTDDAYLDQVPDDGDETAR